MRRAWVYFYLWQSQIQKYVKELHYLPTKLSRNCSLETLPFCILAYQSMDIYWIFSCLYTFVEYIQWRKLEFILGKTQVQAWKMSKLILAKIYYHVYYKERAEDTSNFIHILLVMVRVVAAFQSGGCPSRFHEHLVYPRSSCIIRC